MFSYIESRGGKYDKTVFFGLQYIIQRYLTQRVTTAMIDEAEAFFKLHGEPFNRDGWMHVVNKHGGLLPMRIRAVPEGSVIPTSVPLVTVESTDPDCFWIVSWFETMLMRVWYPTNVATISYQIKKTIMQYLELTSDDPKGEIAFKLHDFGARGVSSQESAAIGGMAHLINFMGSDTVVGVRAAHQYYGEPMAGFSIPATEHSSITSWGKDGEVDAYRNIIDKLAKPGALVACVSDSYDIYNACKKLWGGELRQQVIDSGATLVIRPDSGVPYEVVSKCLAILGEQFGTTLNTKGYKVLNHVRLIQGDGIDHESIKQILDIMTNQGWSTTNIGFGMGGALLQGHNRDTQKFAMKCSSITVDGKECDVFKDPVSDPGKRSKAGRLDTEFFEEYRSIVLHNGDVKAPYSIMQTVYDNGAIMNGTTFAEVRKRANNG